MSDAPNVVWLAGDTVQDMNYDLTCAASDIKTRYCEVGPYVNLEWFLGEVERVANKKMLRMPPIDMISAHKRACKELAQQIKEGKI